MHFHKEGKKIIIVSSVFLLIIGFVGSFFFPFLTIPIIILCLGLLILVLQFFRDPKRDIISKNHRLVYAPADGKVVVIEETEEPEYFKDKRLQVSIFMSPLNVHVNRNPVSGKVNYYKHHKGKYLAAWKPKSSLENERTTVVIDTGETEILLRQIAGAVAKRIINYLKEGDEVTQGEEMGFIKFGSRVDIFLPLEADMLVNVGDKVKGNLNLIAKI
ncbi:MAG: phosphatidylserine decarboxylase family protein [Saprospiraceae bacterium]|nr:phosphatidylserine decarboxylase family protein [Saprospiraceae bacterium]